MLFDTTTSLDQEQNVAVIAMSITDHDEIFNTMSQDNWYPLETVLNAWLDMIDMGKIKAVTGDIKDVHKKSPWINVPYSESILLATLERYHQLVDAIVAAMPKDSASQPSSESSLLDDAILDAAHVPAGFARDFLSKAKAPPFHYIAPGLSVPTGENFLWQPFTNVPLECATNWENQIVKPLLLFRSTEFYYAPPDNDDPSGSDLPFGWPYNILTEYPAGLYFSGADRGDWNVFEDGAKLVLPYPLGVNGYAQKSDGTKIRDERGGGQGSLYQPGYQAVCDTHGANLACVLKNWYDMVKNGDWEVGPEGVIGGIEEFKKADTEDGFEKFVCLSRW